MMNVTLSKIEEVVSKEEIFANKFKDIYLSNDIELFMDLIDENTVWSYMPSGQKFIGIMEIRENAEKTMDERVYKDKDLLMVLTNLFWTEENICFEYLHRGISPDHISLDGYIKAGTQVAVPICITLQIKDGKIKRMNEYMDSSTLIGIKKKLYS